MWLSTLTYSQREAMLRLAHNVIVSDGLLDPNEEGMLEAFRREMAVSADFEVEYLDIDDPRSVDPRKPSVRALRARQGSRRGRARRERVRRRVAAHL